MRWDELDPSAQLWTILSDVHVAELIPTPAVSGPRKIDGVRQVHDQISVLPVSQFDDQLRHRIARAIYSNPNFWNYAIMADPPVHIVVEHSRVTLTGVVQSEVERMVARSIAGSQFGVMSVVNNLKTDAEVKDALEKAF